MQRSNNQLRQSMQRLSLSDSLISTIVNDPSELYSADLNISAATRNYILQRGYMKGFKYVFYLNAGLTASAVFISFMMIRHKDLNQEYEERHALRLKEKEKAEGDIELGSVAKTSEEAPVDSQQEKA